MVTMACCNKRFETVEDSIINHPTSATTCYAETLEKVAETLSEAPEDMQDSDVTADLDELSRADVGGDAWVEEMMALVYAEDLS